MVASALANKAAKIINPDFQMGAMLALSGIYPATCHPEDVFGAYAFRRKALLFRMCCSMVSIPTMHSRFLTNMALR